MKIAIILLLCLSIGALARPSDDDQPTSALASLRNSLQEGSMFKRSAETNSGEQSGSGSKEQNNSILNIPSGVLDTITQMLKSFGITNSNDLKHYVMGLVSGNLRLRTIFDTLSPENVRQLMNQINPLSEILQGIPVVSLVYGMMGRVASVPVSIMSTILSLLAAAISQMLPSAISSAV